MIRLIASDLDGTLLNSQRQLPKDFFSVIDRLNQLGVLFIAASGRSYPTLRRDFAPHSDELCFISDNGARIAEHGKILQKDPIPPQVVSQVLETCACLAGSKTGADQRPGNLREHQGRALVSRLYFGLFRQLSAGGRSLLCS